MQEPTQIQKPVSVENPPTLSPTLTAQEQAVVNGPIRSQMSQHTMLNGAITGAVGGAIIGGIWAWATKSRCVSKVTGTAAAGALAGAFTGQLTPNTHFTDRVSESRENPQQQSL